MSTLTRLALSLCLWFASSNAGAALLDVSPTRLTFTPDQRILALSITNQDANPVVVQMQVMQWTQAQGKDVYQATRNILVTPPIIKLAPHATQAVRLALRVPLNPAKEAPYRIYVQEVYSPLSHPKNSSIHTILRIGIPIFTQPSQPVSKLAWTSKLTAGKNLELHLANGGNQHIQVTKLILKTKDSSKALLSEKVFAYILPGQMKTWQLKLPSSVSGQVQLTADTDEGTISTTLNIKGT